MHDLLIHGKKKVLKDRLEKYYGVREEKFGQKFQIIKTYDEKMFITENDIARLQPKKWINDEIINFYARH